MRRPNQEGSHEGGAEAGKEDKGREGGMAGGWRVMEVGRQGGDGRESEGVWEFLPHRVLMSPWGGRSQTSLTEFLVRSPLPT